MELLFVFTIVVTLGSNWLPVVAGLATAALGYKASKDANKSRDNAVSAQSAWEAANARRAQDQINLADKLLYGQGYDPETGAVESRPGEGALAKAEDWTTNYLDWLTNSADVIYNSQRGRMETDIRDSMSQAARMLGRRGLSTDAVQSGAAAKAMGDIGMARTGILSQLEAGRHTREGANLATGTQLTQGLVDRALNLRAGATGQAINQRTQIPGMMLDQANQQSQQAGAYGNLTGTMLDYYMQSRQPSVQVPTTAPANAVVSRLPSNMSTMQYAPIKMQAQGFGNVPARY